MIKFRCSKCKKLLGGEDKQAGLVVRCPKCKGKTRVPKPGEPAPVQKLDKLEVVEEEDFEIVEEELEVVEEIDLAAFEEEERREKARPKSRRPSEDDEDQDLPRKKPRRPIDDEDDDDDRPRKKPRRVVDEDDYDDDEEEEDDRPRRGSDRGRRGRRRREQPAEFFSRNRISGLMGVILGFFCVIFGIVAFWMFDSYYYPIAALVLGVLFLIAGAIYMVVG
jgi:phage FluMu protein Com